jgi:hypothetical protein
MEETELDPELIKQEAEMSKELLLQDIDVEKRIITKEPDLESKITAIDVMFLHLKLQLEDYGKLHRFLEKIQGGFEKLVNLIQEEISHEVHLLKEGEDLAAEIKKDSKHHRWRVAWKKNKKDMRADIKFLNKIHKQFEKIINIVEDEEHILIKDEKIAALKHNKKEAEELEHIVDYFYSIHQFIKFYKEVFEHMIKKEEHLLQKKKK